MRGDLEAKLNIEKSGNREIFLNGSAANLIIKFCHKERVVLAHFHDRIEIVYCNTSGILNIDGAEFSFDSGDFLLIDFNTLHSVYAADEGGFSAIIITLQYLNSSNKQYTDMMSPFYISRLHCPVINPIDTIYNELKQIYESLYNMQESPLVPALLSEYFKLIGLWLGLPRYEKSAGTQDELIRNAVSYINENLNSDLTLNKLSEIFSLNKFSFFRKFKFLTGYTPNKYVMRSRLEKAAKYLMQGYNVTQTAISIGFENMSYFTKCFSEYYLVLPSDYAKKTGFLK